MNHIAPDRSTPPELHELGPLTLSQAETGLLPNGITVHTLAHPDTEVCRISVAIPGGDAETAPDSAMKIIAPAISEGTIRHSGAEMAEILEAYGAWSGASLSTHYTVYYLGCLSRHLPSLLPLVRETIFEPAFEEETMRRLTDRLATRNEIDRCKVEWRATAALRPALYGTSCPLSYSPTPEEIRAVKADRLRELHFSRLDPSRMHIFLSGGINEDHRRLVAEIFGSVTTGADFNFRSLNFSKETKGGKVFTEMSDSLQSGISVGMPLIGRDNPDFVALRCAVIALGGYFGSRLMLNIREEKGFTYGIGAALIGFRSDGYLSINTQTATEYVPDVEREILHEIERMKDPASYSADELSRLSFYIRSGLASALDSSFSRMDMLQSYFLAGAPDGYFEAQDEIARNLTPTLLADISRRYFDTSRLITSIAGK